MYDIESFITRNFDDYKYIGNPPTDIAICCPFCVNICGEDTKFHLRVHINEDKQVVHCFRCGYASNWWQFVMDITGLPYIRAIGELYVPRRIKSDIHSLIENKYDKHKVKVSDTISKSKSYHNLPSDFELLTNNTSTHLMCIARKYMRMRGFAKSYWDRYGIGVAESVGYRVIIPIEENYWQGRALYSWITPKYLNPKEPAKDLIFNSDALLNFEEVVICEGAFSAMAVGEHAIAIMGKDPTVEKTKRLAKSDVKRFIIALEYGAFNSMGKLADALVAAGKDVVIWEYLDGDPADHGKYVELDYNLKTKLQLLLY